MRKIASLLAALLVLGALLTGCGKPKVSVRTGERVYCTYGELLRDDVRTIDVPADEAGRYSVKKRVELCERHRRLGEIYDVAQGALRRGDVRSAEKALATVVAEDPTFQKAADQLKVIRRGDTPSPDDEAAGNGGGGGSADPPANEPGGSGAKPEGPSASLSRYVPGDLDGFTAQPVVTESFSLTRQYKPADGDLLSLVIVAEQFRDAKAASAAADRYKRAYGKDATTKRVGGRPAFVGTDGESVSGLVMTEGSVTIVMELASAGTEPARFIDELLAVAGQVLD